MVQQCWNAHGWYATFNYALRQDHLSTSTKPCVPDMEFKASVSIFSESDGKQPTDILPGNKGSEPVIPVLLDCVQALKKLNLHKNWKLAVRKSVSSAAESYHRMRP